MTYNNNNFSFRVIKVSIPKISTSKFADFNSPIFLGHKYSEQVIFLQRVFYFSPAFADLMVKEGFFNFIAKS